LAKIARKEGALKDDRDERGETAFFCWRRITDTTGE